jgi:hypothetical protein
VCRACDLSVPSPPLTARPHSSPQLFIEPEVGESNNIKPLDKNEY